MMDELQQTKARLSRKASRAIIGGFRPTEDPFASWFGRIRLALPNEMWPFSNDKPMLPLAQLNLAEMPYCPVSMNDIALITVFIDQDELPSDTANGDGWLLRAYASLDGLVPIAAPAPASYIKPYPIKWELIAEDYPTWDDASNLGVPNFMNEDEDEGYSELFETQQGTKIGGWPFTVQSEIYWAPLNQHFAKPEYIFQIDTEQKANWSWGDAGFGYFGRGTGNHRDIWVLEWQCY